MDLQNIDDAVTLQTVFFWGNVDGTLSINGRCPTFAKLTWGVTTTRSAKNAEGHLERK